MCDNMSLFGSVWLGLVWLRSILFDAAALSCSWMLCCVYRNQSVAQCHNTVYSTQYMEIKYRLTCVCVWVSVIVQRYHFSVVSLFAIKKYKQFTDLLLFTRFCFSLSLASAVCRPRTIFFLLLYCSTYTTARLGLLLNFDMYTLCWTTFIFIESRQNLHKIWTSHILTHAHILMGASTHTNSVNFFRVQFSFKQRNKTMNNLKMYSMQQ